PAQLAGTRPVDRAVDDDPVQPRAERPAPVEAIQRPNCRQERLLGDVLGGSLIMDDEVRSAVGERPVRAEEGLEIGGRPGLGPANPGALLPRARHRAPTIRANASGRSIAADTGATRWEVRGPSRARAA